MKKKPNLVLKLVIAILAGIAIGAFLPKVVTQVLVTFSGLFSSYLKFIIPLMIIGFVVVGIAELSNGAGKLLGLTTGIAYTSTVVAGSLAYLMACTFFPSFISAVDGQNTNLDSRTLEPLFSIPLEPMLDVTAAIVFAFVMGISISYLRRKGGGETMYRFFSEFSEIITRVLKVSIIPLLPLYVAGTFANMTYSGETAQVLSVFWKVFLMVIALHMVYLFCLFCLAGAVGKKNPLQMIRNQIPAYLTAVGTQSSAATIPVNVNCAEKNGVTKEIREFVVPLCATIHLAGSIITVTSCVTAVLMMNGMDYQPSLIIPFVFMLGIAMVAAPGAPGGAIMSALPFLPLVGIPSEGVIASLLIALYITQDSFGTAANVSGDNAIAVLVDAFYKKHIVK